MPLAAVAAVGPLTLVGQAAHQAALGAAEAQASTARAIRVLAVLAAQAEL
ncbi:MAG: hypothetical protein WD042_03105 [Phycisphaeraceae bacterium]